MTINGGKPHAVGDHGQRYEVHYKDEHNKDHVFGWVSTPEGYRALSRSIKLHPTMHSPRVRDRTTGKWVDVNGD